MYNFSTRFQLEIIKLNINRGPYAVVGGGGLYKCVRLRTWGRGGGGEYISSYVRKKKNSTATKTKKKKKTKSTYAQGGEGVYEFVRLRTWGGGGVEFSGISAYVLNGWSLG